MSARRPPVALTPEERARVDAAMRHAAAGPKGIQELARGLSDPSWSVRRAVVGALARGGDAALPALCASLRDRDGDENRLAATVDALVASAGDADGAVLRVLDEDHDATVVCDCAQILGRRRSARALPALAERVHDPDDNVAVAAVEALGRIGGAAAIEPLLAAVASGSFFRVFPAIDVLGRSGDPRAVPALVALLDEPLYMLEAARALGRTGSEAAVPALVAVLPRPGDARVRTAAAALVELHDRAPRDAAPPRGEPAGLGGAVLRALADAPGHDVIARRIGQCIAGADVPEKAALCRVLGWLGGEAAVAVLLEQLDAEPPVARAAASALAAIGRDAEPQLASELRDSDSARRVQLLPLLGRRASILHDVVACLADPDPTVRALASEALGRMGDPTAVHALFRLLGDADPRVAQAAVGAVQSLGSAETEELTLAAARSPDARTRRSALRIIGYFGYRRGLEPLVAAMGDPDERVRDAAIYGLPFLDDPGALDALLAAARHAAPRTRAAAMRALGQTSRDPRVVARLERGLADADPWVRYYACQALGRLREPSLTSAVAALVHDEAGQVRVAVVEALAQLDTPEARAILLDATRAADPDVQRAALLGLGATVRPDALPPLLEATRSDDAATRLVALSALAAFASPDADAALARLATDADPSVQKAATNALGARAGAAATEALLGLLADPALRPGALEALAHPSPGRIAALAAALEAADDALAPLLVDALARMRADGATTAILDALGRGQAPARRAAAAALIAIKPAGVEDALERAAAHDSDPEVRRLAALAAGAPGAGPGSGGG